jgi:hypothetical protein
MNKEKKEINKFIKKFKILYLRKKEYYKKPKNSLNFIQNKGKINQEGH